ncbi:MAG: Na+-dependent transporter [Cyanobacteria bacterium DS3.002]|nr:Na+-dependent transporter [Cyanobacteria bacterium DS3.002]MBA4049633.1 Na+-dependent transporter [Cyanobacteria bacterium DS2.008]MBA4073402.1 Na+-dependent transporter [Cyanobacteria bacterium PR.023]
MKIEKVTHWIHQYFLPLLISSYILAGIAPQFGDFLRHCTLGTVNLPGLGATNFSLSLIMLGYLLFNAGLGIKAKELIGLQKKPQILLLGLAANMVVPIVLIFALRSTMGLWHNQDELHNLLTGLALIIAMPIAGSSAAWAQNANGNLSLSLGLILLSTILSPYTTPIILHIFGSITIGDYSEDLHEMASQGTNAFLCLTVVLPALLGMATNFIAGEKRVAVLKPWLKFTNFIVLLTLNYSNASNSLPQVFKTPDWDFLALIVGFTAFVCAAAFGAGWLISHLCKTDQSDKAALMFGLGMNNNGTGLVLAATALADHPAVMLPMIAYTLVQQIVAALVDWKIFKRAD